jgi:hypothetical protein
VSSLSDRKREKQLTFTSINDSQFIIEGYYNKVKIGGESEYAISYIDFHDGPLFHIGNDFLGRGKIIDIQTIDSQKENYIIVKISLEQKDEDE